MRTIDAHVHFFSRPFFEALAKASPLPGSLDEKLAAVAAKAKIELPCSDLDAHAGRWRGELERHGVERMACFASLPEETASVSAACRASAGKLVGFALFSPRVGTPAEAATRAARAIDEQGLRGFLLFPALHHYRLDDPELDPVWKEMERRRAVLIVHCGLLVVKLRELFGLPRTIDIGFANPLALAGPASRFPGIRFVIPHFGAGFLRETLLLGAQAPNVYVDSSSSHSWRAVLETPLSLSQVFERALAVYGARRILFGTDSGAFPAGWRAERRSEQLEALRLLGLDAADTQRIFAGNAEELWAAG